MNEKLFRKNSIDRVTSPEQLNEYIRVAKPSVWVLLAAIVALLLGTLVWGIFGTIETKTHVGIEVTSSQAVCYVDETTAEQLEAGMTVTAADKTGMVLAIAQTPVEQPKNPSLSAYSGLTAGNFCYEVTLSMPNLSEGIYSGEIGDFVKYLNEC